MTAIFDYFWPNPPAQISVESHAALQSDLRDANRRFSGALDDKHRSAVNIWTRHSDNLARAENREWFREHGQKFVRRWAFMSCLAWLASWLVSGVMILEVLFVLVGFISGVLAVFFQYLRRIE